MSDSPTNATSRRRFLTESGRLAGVSTLAGMTIPYVHAAENNTIQLALVGCGGRGTGAAENALGVQNGPIKLVAMADVFPSKLADSHGKLRQKFGGQVDVPEDRKFIGFDGYRKALDCLKPGDVAIFGAFMPHRSDTNRSSTWRRHLLFSYNRDSDGGDCRRTHYQDFHHYLREIYGSMGLGDMHFR